jgi:small subunit ribosomal protein S17
MTKTVKVKKESVEAKPKGKVLSGVVTSDKMKDTVVVSVSSYEKHPKYGKFIKSQKKFKAHDAGNTCKIGDKVTIRETRPLSKTKYFMVIK